jgi:DNA-binding beta-propeller fold protein YncE
MAQVPRGIDNIALSPDDRLFISHFVDGRVSEAGADGNERILSESGLVGPFGLAVAPDGRILVADGLSVAVVDRDGTITRTHTLIADLPTLAVDIATLDGDPVVLGQRGQVFRCRPGEPGVPIAGRLAAPTALADSGDGGVLVVEQGAGRVVRVDGSGVTGEVAGGLQRPHGVAVAPDGTVWVTCADALVALRDGAVFQRIPALAGAQGVAVMADGGVIAAHPATNRFVAVDAASGVVRTLVDAAPISSPVANAELPHASTSIVADGAGFLVGCSGDGTIRRLTPAS